MKGKTILEADERAFAERMQEGLEAPVAPPHLHQRLQSLAVETEAKQRRPNLRKLGFALAPALALAGAFYVRAHVQPTVAPSPIPKASPDPKASPGPKHPLGAAGADAVPEPATVCLLLPGLLLLSRYRRSQTTS